MVPKGYGPDIFKVYHFSHFRVGRQVFNPLIYL